MNANARFQSEEIFPPIVLAAQEFADGMAALDRQLRRGRSTLPPPAAKAEAVQLFTAFMHQLTAIEAAGPVPEADLRVARDIAGRWLFRSRIWNRAYHKPHGHAGDFMVIEWMYDLETDACATPFQPAIVNCLDHVAREVPSTASVWERRRFFAELLRAECARRNGRLRVLDLAGGGGRYLRDFLGGLAANVDVHVTLVDQDPAAIEYCRAHALADWSDKVTLHCASVRDLAATLGDARFDVVISAGLFDYLSEPVAQALLAEAARRLTPGGTIAIANLHPADPSRLVKTWLVDWALIYRDETACARLFPAGLAITTTCSSNGGLCYAVGRAPAE